MPRDKSHDYAACGLLGTKVRWGDERPKMVDMRVSYDARAAVRAYCAAHKISDWCVFASDLILDALKKKRGEKNA